MSNFLHFRGNRRRVPSVDERALLEQLTASVQVMWRGGWAEACADGVVLLRNRQCLGV
jgi:hypothetical protein